ncbi:hypothetical protein KA082_02140 [Candidatus Woesebacteria bacterium]|nr:hypothetical protein [Candidatus Woesebacteria bacterium]
MSPTVLTALVDEKQLMRYCMSVTGVEKTLLEETLAECLYWNILSSLSVQLNRSQLQEAGVVLRDGTVVEQQTWLTHQEPELLAQISETIDRTFLSLEKTI